MKEKLKKLMMNTLSNTPGNKALLLLDFSVQVRSTLGVSMNDNINELSEAIEELQEKEFIRYENTRNGGRVVRGLNFDDYFVTPADNKTNNFNIGSIAATNVQVGNNNTQSIQQGFEDLIDKLNKSNISEEDKKSAKLTLRSVLNNASIASILGGTVSGLLSLL
ncbi:hypothetical protein KWH75_06870 [Morganella morganii]|uniref:hypothetical protein n=1 Tax=Morganella morganii TaxID=582 RepID=UPI0021D218E3|nr:hypothetical protein [Morganella morganii]MCU6236790.1 hypothetical protein [Morganella morganii]